MPVAIRIENLSKQYRLGQVSTRTLSHDLNRWFQMNVLDKEDPYLKIGETNDPSVKGDSEYVWALKNINLEVQEGEILGIIGKNGAGKSTLLKILSKVTSPTTGTIKARGRIASLLEVGTGFHPEMTGRENIFMNGAILGMSKPEIRQKLDEIIDFAGVERFIDTPVKRYSSGMIVRLGFAVAAHLDPEILVVDEVLAVGDEEFQKKAIGKMEDISKGYGKTILLVSHNMGSIRKLCSSVLILTEGKTAYFGNTEKVINQYINYKVDTFCGDIKSCIKHTTKDIEIQSISLNGLNSRIIYCSNSCSSLCVEISGMISNTKKMSVAVCFNDYLDQRIATFDPGFTDNNLKTYQKGEFHIIETILLPKYINKGEYYLDILIINPGIEYIMKAENAVKLIVEGFINVNGKTLTYKESGFHHLLGIKYEKIIDNNY